MFTYTTTTVNFVTSGTLTAISSSLGATSTNCPKGRVLRENGRKLFPDANPGVSTYMVGVYDAQTLFSGFIDPNSPVFTVYNTDKSNFLADGVDPGPGGLTDKGAPVYTNSSVEARTTVTAGTIVYGTTGVGYPLGTGAVQTQSTNKGTTVVLNAVTGTITTANTIITALSPTASFTFNNSFIGADDMLMIYAISSAAKYVVVPSACTAGSCTIVIRNISGADQSEAIPLRFAVIKSAVA
jgi:hypothetical protein